MPQSPNTKSKSKKRGGPKDKDDEVDEYGNLPGLIDYDYSSGSDSDCSLSSSDRHRLKKGKLPTKIRDQLQGRPPRAAAIKAGEAIRKKLEKEVLTDSDSTYVKPKKYGFAPKKKDLKKHKVQEKEEEEEQEEDEEDGETLGSQDTDDDEDEYEDDEEDEDVEEDEEDESPFKGISISFGGMGEEPDQRMIPRRHNMKKESEAVKKFVKLVTKPAETDTIDDQIDQFKELTEDKRQTMIEALEKRSEYAKKEQPLMFRLLQMKLKPEMMGMVMARYNAMNNLDPSSGEYYKMRSWMEKLVSMPLGIYKEMPVSLSDSPEECAPFMEKARKYLDDAIYGQDDSKLQIMQFIASKIANPTASGLSLLLVGPPGIGKTSLIKNGIAKALEWPFQFISLGGDSDSSTYTGHQFVYEGSHSGKIANCLGQAKSMSMVLMFDELDKISATPKGEEIQNLLVHLTDPVQNSEFEDKYLTGIPLDMSRTMFVFSANDLAKVDRILLDRMVVVSLAGYDTKDKIVIAEKFLLPGALKEVNLAEKVAISKDVLQHILETYAKEEPGVRELKRCIEQIAQRINMLRMFNVKELPFHIPGFTLPFVLKKEHVDLFLKKKNTADKVPMGMYT
jgi:ATP-dependent Lon protease